MSSDAQGANATRSRRGLIQLFTKPVFLLTVVVPTLASGVYYGLIASDVYISEARFVVRSPERQVASGIGAFLKGAGFSRSEDDTYTVHDYMLSRDALKSIDAKHDLMNVFGRPQVDLLSRFAPFGFGRDFETLHQYYQKHVVIDTELASSISVLRVSAFSSQDAYDINRNLLEIAEDRVNQLNDRGRQDLIRFAESEVEIAEARARQTALALSGYRNNKVVFDPDRQSAIQLQLVAKLQDELIATKSQIDQIRTFTPDNPQLPALRKRAAGIQAEMDTQMQRVTGSDGSLTNKSADYERLVLDKTFAEKQLAAAMQSSSQARSEAQRKQLYLERVVQPSKPDVAVEPRRARAILTTFILGLMAWGIASILLAGLREHKD